MHERPRSPKQECRPGLARAAGPGRRGPCRRDARGGLRPRLALALAAALPSGLACAPAEPETLALGRPPVVLIVLDALGSEHVHHLGYERETTPALDALAAEGLSFRNAFAPAPYTLASIPSLLTGRLPDSHGVTSRLASLPESDRTLAEHLTAVGYRTRGAVANYNGGPTYGAMRGFEELVELYRAEGERGADFVARDGAGMHIPTADEFPPLVARWLEPRAADTASGRTENGATAPLFLYLHVLEPHTPYAPPEPYRSLWLDPEYAGPFAAGDSAALVQEKQGKLEVGDADRRAARDLYDGNLRWADHNVELVLDQLRAAELYDEALIVVTSDHGEAFWQHGEWGHNDQLYDEALRVPLIVKFPRGVLAQELVGTVPEGLVSIVDLAPSVARWLDLPVGGAPFDGRPLDGAFATADGAVETEAERGLFLRSHHRIPHVGLRTPSHKTILERHEKDGSTVGIEYYWLTADPLERNNLSERRTKETGPVIRRLEDWIRTATVNRARRDIPLTVMEEKMLDALGYAGD